MTWKHNPVGWFEIPATDIDRAAAFAIDLQARRMVYALMVAANPF